MQMIQSGNVCDVHERKNTMARKSKQAGGNMPLTHYERTKKFASSEYGTTATRVAGHSQYQLGDCALSISRLNDSALCTPSGYLYDKEAILEYLIKKTQEIKEQQAAFDAQQEKNRSEVSASTEKKLLEKFEDSQKIIRKRKADDESELLQKDMKRTSYWLATSQPVATEQAVTKPAERPESPHSGEPLRRKQLWPLHLQWENEKLVCGLSDKAIGTQSATAYWTDEKKPGTIVLSNIYTDLISVSGRCPTTNKKVKKMRLLQKSGTSYAASGQSVQANKYRPTIT